MYKRKDKLHLNIHVPGVGQNPNCWRLLDNPFFTFTPEFYKEVVLYSEKGKFDAIFFSDALALHSHTSGSLQMFDPIVLCSMLTGITNNIGLIPSISTTFNNPYNIARIISTIDHMSKGRSGINIITTYNQEALKNFNLYKLNKIERYERAEEFIQVMKKLWNSWEKDSLVCNKKTGIFAHKEKVHEINHTGKYFKIKGPLNIPHMPQSNPLIAQSGGSEYGIDLGAKYADVIYTSQSNISEAIKFYKKIKDKAKFFRRTPESILILPGVYIILGDTMDNAKRKCSELNELRNMENSIKMVSTQLNIPIKYLHLDKPIPFEYVQENKNNISEGFQQNMLNLARNENLTLRELINKNLALVKMIVGTPETIADELELWFNNYAADGFNITIDLLPNGLLEIVENLIPILQKRNIFRKHYTNNTLKNNFFSND